MAEINLGQILKELGYKSESFSPHFPIVPGKYLKPDGHTRYPNTKPRKERGTIGEASFYAPNKVAANLEYFLPVTLEYNIYGTVPTYEISPGVIAEERGIVGKEKIELPFPVLSISGKKRLVETNLTQRTGTVKELISSDGYEISIRGYMIGREGTFPEDDIKTLRTLFEINEPVTIHNVVTDIFLIRPRNVVDKVVITELSFPEARGNKHVREYEMKLVNDAPFNLSIIK